MQNSIDLQSFLLPTLSTIAVIIAMFTDDKLVTKDNKSIFKRIKPITYFLFSIAIFINFNTTCSSNKTLREATIKANAKELRDSIRIAELQQLAKTNLERTDSVKVQLIDNAVKALDEQRQAIERERENTFIHLQKEVKDNLRKILLNFDENAVRGFVDADGFLHTRLDDTYIKKYESISSQPLIIEHYMKTTEVINKINDYADILVKESDKKRRKLTINMFVKNIDEAYGYLSPIFVRIYNLNSYKKYETLDFSLSPIEIEKQKLKDILLFEYMNKFSEMEKDTGIIEDIKRNNKGDTN